MQAVSGEAYTDAGATPLVAGRVSATINGASAGQASTGANGYFYIAQAAGAIPAAGASVLTYDNGPAPGAGLSAATGTTAGLDIYGGFLRYGTTATLFSAAEAGKSATLAAISAPGFVSALSPFVLAGGPSFTLDQPLTLTGSLGAQTTAPGATLSVSAPIAVGAGSPADAPPCAPPRPADGGSGRFTTPSTLTGLGASRVYAGEVSTAALRFWERIAAWASSRARRPAVAGAGGGSPARKHASMSVI